MQPLNRMYMFGFSLFLRLTVHSIQIHCQSFGCSSKQIWYSIRLLLQYVICCHTSLNSSLIALKWVVRIFVHCLCQVFLVSFFFGTVPMTSLGKIPMLFHRGYEGLHIQIKTTVIFIILSEQWNVHTLLQAEVKVNVWVSVVQKTILLEKQILTKADTSFFTKSMLSKMCTSYLLFP